MMGKKYFLSMGLIGFIFLGPVYAKACTCWHIGSNFFETVYKHNLMVEKGEISKDFALTVISGEVKDHIRKVRDEAPRNLLVKVNGILQGKLVSKEIEIDPELVYSCYYKPIDFPVGKSFEFAFRSQPYNNSYRLDGCGEYFKEIVIP